MRYLLLSLLLVLGCTADIGAAVDDAHVLVDLAAIADLTQQAVDPCRDQRQDGDETDVDCGGTCGDCDDGRHCKIDDDCLHQLCVDGECKAGPSCSDGRVNGSETDEDCGGPCPPCPLGKACLLNVDCSSHLCRGRQCATPMPRHLAFAGPANYAVTDGPRGLAATDLNADNLLDLVVAIGGGESVGVLFGKVGGSFGSVVLFPAGGMGPWAIAIGDFDRNGKNDVAAILRGTNEVAILSNRNGALGPPEKYATENPNATYLADIAAGDFDGDGNMDVAASYTGGGSVLLNRGGGRLDKPRFLPIAGESALNSVDLDGDGRVDILALGGSTAWLLLGALNGQLAVSWRQGAAVTALPSIAPGDYNGDGRVDFVAAGNNQGVAVLVPFLNDGSGGFRNGPGVPTDAARGQGVVRADFNQDGWDDLAVGASATGQIDIVLGNGDGTFTPAIKLDSGGKIVYGIAVGDFNRDGKPDIAATYNLTESVAVFLNTSN